jgi:hypothetical protein
MNKNQKPKIGTEELVDTFSNIDGRISELHKHSSGVFMQLNSYLKDYYKKINIISENASRIFDTILGNEKNNLLKELDTLYIEIKDYRQIAEEENKKSIKHLNTINVKANYLSVAIRNFNQDLITFKYLTTNYRLISNYEKFDPEWNKTIEEWESETGNVQPSLGEIGKEINQLKTQISGYLNINELSSADSSKKISGLTNEIKSIYNNVLEKNHQSETYFPVIKEKSKRSSDSIGNIITHLQYHDIIRQKIEHIQQYHQNIINTIKSEQSNLKNLLDESASQRFNQIGEIVGLQAEQLILVSREYQNALEVITRNFQIIADDINTISNISNEFCSDGKNKEVTLLKQVKDKLDEGILMLDVNSMGVINRDLLTVRDTIRNIHNLTLQKVTDPLNKLEKAELFRGRELNPGNKKSESNPGILYQIASLASDISVKKYDLLQRVEELIELAGKFKTSEDNNGQGSRTEQEQIRLMVKVTRILDSLDEDNRQLDSVLVQNGKLNQDIINEIEGTINKVDYYELFEKVLKTVIEKLNDVNIKLKVENGGLNKNTSEGDLKEIESMYTVESERIIHKNYLSGELNKDITPTEEPQEDIELF